MRLGRILILGQRIKGIAFNAVVQLNGMLMHAHTAGTITEKMQARRRLANP
jgi:hypothetical protein